MDKFQYGYVFTIWPSNFGKITFWSLFWKIVILVPKLGRLSPVYFMHWDLLFDLFLSIFHIFIVGSPNDP